MWEVCRGGEQVHEAARHSALVNVFSDQLTDKVFAGASPAVQREDEGFLRVLVGHEAGHSFEEDTRCHVLAEQLALQIRFET